MFETEKLIYLQMQKTGSTQIASLLYKCIGGTQMKKHNILKDYETDKLIIGSIRNPWHWYVSLWAFGCGGKGGLYNSLTKRSLLRIILGNTELSYKDIWNVRARWNELTKPINIWSITYKNYEDPNCFKKWLKLIYNPQRKRDLGEGYSESSISEFAGFMTYRYCKFFIRNFLSKYFKKIRDINDLRYFDKTHNILDGVIRNESLEDDLIRVLQQAGHNIDDAMIKLIYESANNKKMTSKHHDASFYYDDATSNLIEEKEKFIIEKYGYKPPTCM